MVRPPRGGGDAPPGGARVLIPDALEGAAPLIRGYRRLQPGGPGRGARQERAGSRGAARCAAHADSMPGRLHHNVADAQRRQAQIDPVRGIDEQDLYLLSHGRPGPLTGLQRISVCSLAGQEDSPGLVPVEAVLVITQADTSPCGWPPRANLQRRLDWPAGGQYLPMASVRAGRERHGIDCMPIAGLAERTCGLHCAITRG